MPNANLTAARTAYAYRVAVYYAAPTRPGLIARVAAGARYNLARAAYRVARRVALPGRTAYLLNALARNGRAALTAALGPATVAPGSNAAYATYAAGLRRSLPPALTRPPGYGA